MEKMLLDEITLQKFFVIIEDSSDEANSEIVGCNACEGDCYAGCSSGCAGGCDDNCVGCDGSCDGSLY